MDNFNFPKTILENIIEQNEKINKCIEIVNGNTTDEETGVNQEIERQFNELDTRVTNNENRFVEINQQFETVNQQLDKIMIMIEKNTNDIKKLMENNSEPIGWTGKTASFYGDSLTEVNNHYTKGYHQWIKEILELKSYNNYGKSGYRLSNIYSKINEVTDDSDLIIVMGGVNDQTFSVPLGTMDDNTTSTTYGSINLICSKLKEKYPSKTILFITPHFQTRYPHDNGITSKEVADAIIKVCNKYSIPVYDNYSLGGINIDNLSTYTTDGCHWNDIAHEMVGKKIAEFIYSNLKPSDGSTEEPPTEPEKPPTEPEKPPTEPEEPPTEPEEPPKTGEPPFDGIKVTLTQSKFPNFVHLVALCAKGSNFNIGESVHFSLKFSEPDGIESVNCASIFADTTGELYNDSFTSTIATQGVTVKNDNNEFVGAFKISKDDTSEYVKVTLKINFTKLPSSFKVDNIGVKCNDVNIDILKIGGFFKGEQMTFVRT